MATAIMGAAIMVALTLPGTALASGLAPVAVADTVSTLEDTVANGNVLVNDSDPEGDPLVVTAHGTVNPAHGAIVVASDGAYTFTPAAQWAGGTSTWYSISDGTSSRMAMINITVTAVDDTPVAIDKGSETDEDTALEIAEAWLLAGATDEEGADLTVAGVADATGGGALLDAGVVTFTPTANLCGAGTGGFDYTVSDGNTSGTARITVDIVCVNDPPTPVDDAGAALQGSAVASYDVLANDTDVDDDVLELVAVVVDPEAGTVGIEAGEVTFAPAADFSGDALITYTITDGQIEVDATLTVAVSTDVTPPVVTAPVITFGTGRVDESAPLHLSWGATDAGSGVASYTVQVMVNGGAFTTIYSGTATSITRFYAFNRQLVWRVRATDGEGNISTWETSGARRIYAYQSPGSSKIGYSGTWKTVRSTGSSGVGFQYTTTQGKFAQLTFIGREVMYVAPQTWTSAYVKVYVDGVLLGRFGTYKASAALGQIIARTAWGPAARHTIRIVNDESGKRAALDVFVVLR